MPAAIRQALQDAWERSDLIFSWVAPAALHERPIPLRHPFIFYLGHLPAFSWNQVGRGLLGRPPVDPRLDDLFARGIDPLDAGSHPGAPARQWPAVDRILDYRDRVRGELLEVLDEVLALGTSDPLARDGLIYQVVLEHELMHHETLLYMLQELPHGLKRPPPEAAKPPTAGAAAERERRQVEVPAGPARLGASPGEVPFGWDNEFPDREVEVPAFRIDTLPVTNQEFRGFVEEGGYRDPRHWDREDWAWKESQGLDMPVSWSRENGDLRVRGPFRDHPWEEASAWPVQVSHAEARAFCAAAGRRLPREDELQRAAFRTPEGEERPHPWGREPFTPERANLDFRNLGPVPVGTHPAGTSAFGVHELVGNGWEWTRSAFRPLPGFEPYVRTYPGYSADFFDDHHYVLLGGSWATDRRLLRRSFRNWFQPRYPWVFSKFRAVEGAV